jgi:L-iditol 2-dehydrogenase
MCDNLRSIGYEFNGGFAEYMVVPETAIRGGCVNPIPGNLSFAEAAIAEPLACAINGQNLLETGMGDTVAIIGAGPLGCMHAQLAKARGAAKVIIIEVQKHRLEMAREFGADVLVDSSSESAEQRVREETGGLGASVVIVCAPSAVAQQQSLQLAAKHGRISFFGGLPKSNPTVSLDANLIHYRELFIMGAYGSKPRDNRAALDLLAGGKIRYNGLIGATIPLDRLLEGLDSVAAGKYLKVVVQPDGE